LLKSVPAKAQDDSSIWFHRFVVDESYKGPHLPCELAHEASSPPKKRTKVTHQDLLNLIDLFCGVYDPLQSTPSEEPPSSPSSENGSNNNSSSYSLKFSQRSKQLLASLSANNSVSSAVKTLLPTSPPNSPPSERSVSSPSFSKKVTTRDILHYRYAWSLVETFKKIIKKESHCMMRIRIPEGGKLTIVGDTHGQLFDVLTALHIHDGTLCFYVINCK
jgi:hypothetical protein